MRRSGPQNSWVIYAGDAQRASLMPVGGDRFYFFFDVPLAESVAKTNIPEGDIRAELSQHFAGWAEPVQQLIQKLDPCHHQPRPHPRHRAPAQTGERTHCPAGGCGP
jgi:hypothetical protein